MLERAILSLVAFAYIFICIIIDKIRGVGSMPAYIYVNDVFKFLKVKFNELLEAWEAGRMKPFEFAREIVEEELGQIKNVRFYGAYFNPEKMTAVIEYMVDFQVKGSSGTYGVKIVYAEYPAIALLEYYRAEKEGKLVK